MKVNTEPFNTQKSEEIIELCSDLKIKPMIIDGRKYYPIPSPFFIKTSVWIKWKVKMAIRRALRKLCESASR